LTTANPTPSDPSLLKLSRLLTLPDEIKLQIAEHLSNSSVKHRISQSDLLNFALICKTLTPIARDILYRDPIIDSSNIVALLATILKYAGLRGKVRSLAIESEDTRKEQAKTALISALDTRLLRDCVAHIDSLSIDQATKNTWILELSYRNGLEYPGSLVCVLFTLLSQLKELYLRSSTLVNFPLFRVLIPCVPATKFPEAWSKTPYLTFVLELLGLKLKVLELPNSFHISPTAQSWKLPDVSGIPTYLPNLRHLIIPSNSVYETWTWWIVEPKLERLTLTNAGDPDVDDWVGDLCTSKKPQYFPNLKTVELYYGVRTLPATQRFRAHMFKSRIECKQPPNTKPA
jgi:hypothetical protein